MTQSAFARWQCASSSLTPGIMPSTSGRSEVVRTLASSRSPSLLASLPLGGAWAHGHKSACLLLHAPMRPCPPAQPWSIRTHASSSSNSSSQEGGQAKPSSSVLTLPTLLTIARVVAIPFLVAAWYWQHPASTTTVTAIFILASLTDWLDGYLARKMNLHSRFGAFLDPVADKLMVAALLILLSTRPLAAGPWAGNDWAVPAMTLAIIGREITMSGLREWAATLGGAARDAVAVNTMGKWKTATQMTALTLLLVARDGGSSGLVQAAGTAGPVLLAIGTWLTVHSLVVYLKALWPHMSS